jgi:hypothetical protein
MDKLTDQDIQLLQQVYAHVQQAEKNYEAAQGARAFVENTIAERYKVGAQDKIDMATGSISRPISEETT